MNVWSKLSRRRFVGLALFAGGAMTHSLSAKILDPAPKAEPMPPGEKGDLMVRFLGTGVGSNGMEDGPRARSIHGQLRRWTSILLDGRVLVDFTAVNFETLPKGCSPEVIFYTHSHPDHFDPAAALSLGVKRIYCHNSWAKIARGMFRKAGNGRRTPDVIGLEFGMPVVEGGMTFTSLPANHSTSKKNERCSIYLVEKGTTRFLYATDTCGLPRDALKLTVNSRNPPNPLTAIVMEATAGVGHQNDAGLFFSHSSVDTVARTVQALVDTGRYRPPFGRNVFITHLWRAHYPPQAETDADLPSPLKAAYDGLEVVF